MNHEDVRNLCEQQGIVALPEGAASYVPPESPDYVFRKELVSEMIVFWLSGEKAMKLTGPAGCGKTSLVEQFHAALRYPLLMPNTNSRTEADDLIGKVTAGPAGWGYVPGPLHLAGENGISIFVDEYNVMSAGAITSLNRAAEGNSIDIPETGERIIFNQGFRLFAAANPNDKALGFFGRNPEDASNRERFWTVEFGYPDAADEQPLIEKALTSVFDDDTAATFAASMLEVAGRVRRQYMGENDGADALEVTMSTRTLVRWARAAATFATVVGQGSDKNPFRMGLERALTNAAPRESRNAIHEILADVMK